MIRIGILGDIGSGKTFISKIFGFPVFNADEEVGKIYKNDKNIFIKLKKVLPNYFHTFPINKREVLKAILDNQNNLKKIVKIIHLEIKKKLITFLKKNKEKKIVILDIPLLLENQINKKNDFLIYVQANKVDIMKRLIKRKNFNKKLLIKFKGIQLPLDYKKKKSQYVIINNFKKKSVKKEVKNILNKIL